MRWVKCGSWLVAKGLIGGAEHVSMGDVLRREQGLQAFIAAECFEGVVEA